MPPLIRETPLLRMKGDGISNSGFTEASLSQSTISFSLPRKVFLAANFAIPTTFSRVNVTETCFIGGNMFVFSAVARRLV